MNGERTSVKALHGMVAAGHPLAAQAGAQLLADGGNAFDDAVAVAAALGVVEPAMSGLAGMGVATCWIASERQVRVLDFIGHVPFDFPSDRFTRIGQLNRGAFSCGVPCNLAGWAELIAAHGRKGLGDALEPAAASPGATSRRSTTYGSFLFRPESGWVDARISADHACQIKGAKVRRNR
ncbi:gamma-glutamyltransferase [Bradyrhizobium sp.]|uniref:gamma-glutamyltransferase n=1 Tax=Bradyrhizobium sp. TaxID=376 RepID=UPI0025C115C5|nr:gamma-glutamyltransferase [Bradyrhizobium sp.]MBV8921107.1 gamma-glutamyltransferase [Bradyrhizobium sp.]